MDGSQSSCKRLCFVRPRHPTSATSSSRSRLAMSSHHVGESSGSSNSSNGSVETLLDLCAKVVAFHFPFARIEERYERIPEPVQRRIIFWSFPQSERDICMYSNFPSECTGCGQDKQEVPFCLGVRLYDNNAVNNVLQVGFHLSGIVTENSSSSSPSLPSVGYPVEPEKRYRVSITFDRCKITAVSCSCNKKDIFWCQHVVALSLYRIRNPHKVTLRVPISETLLELNREQLQKLLQHIISDHHTEILPTAQKYADEIMKPDSDKNRTHGAPDPTSGPLPDADHSWHLDETQVSEKVRSYLSQGHTGLKIQNLNALFSKIKEMLRARDSNAARMLRLMTEEFLADPRLPVWRSSQNTPMTDKCRILWDQLACLWVCIVLNPHACSRERRSWKVQLEKWSKLGICPLEDYEFPRSSFINSASLKRRISAIEDSSDEDDDEENPADNNNNNLNLSSSSSSSHNSNRYNSSSLHYNPNHRSSHHPHHRSSSSSSSHNSLGSSSSSSSRNLPPAPRSIFQRALDACHLRWDDRQLRFILDHDVYSSHPPSLLHNGSPFKSQGYQLWHSEPIPTAAARVEALRSHGYRKEALRLAVAVVRTMKRHQKDCYHRWQAEYKRVLCSASTSHHYPMLMDVDLHTSLSNPDAWIGNLLDPISSLFDTLAEASLAPDSKSLEACYPTLSTESSSSPSVTAGAVPGVPFPGPAPGGFGDELFSSVITPAPMNSTSNNSREKPRYRHVYVPGFRDRPESYLTLALECALIGLGQQRLMPFSPYAQDKARVQEEQLIRKLSDIDLDPMLVSALRKQAEIQLNGGPYSGLGSGIHVESAPMHTFARFLFTSLLPFDVDLAYNIGIKAMRLPILDGIDDSDDSGHSHNGLGRYPRLSRATCDHIQKQQCILAAKMLDAAKEDRDRLRRILDSAQKNVHSSQKLFHLAECALKCGLPADGCTRHHELIRIAYEIGQQVMGMTLANMSAHSSRRRVEMIHWLTNCAIELGPSTLKQLMEQWYLHFTASEAVMYVAPIIGANFGCKMGLDFSQMEELHCCARKLALECINRDPHNCALKGLELCIVDRFAFNEAFQSISYAAMNGRINSQILFQVSKFIETHSYLDQAYKLGLQALRGVNVPYNGDQNAYLNDIHWLCSLAYQLGRNELSELISVVVMNIKCATILSDILKKCSTGFSPIPSLPPALAPHHPYSDSRKGRHKLLIDKPPLRILLDAAIAAYVETTKQRLQHISPRHYSDFIEFLAKAQDTFKLAPDGMHQFKQLLEGMRLSYKGKKKLMTLVKDKFMQETRLIC